MLDSVKRLLEVVQNLIYNSVKIPNKCFGLIATSINKFLYKNKIGRNVSISGASLM